MDGNAYAAGTGLVGNQKTRKAMLHKLRTRALLAAALLLTACSHSQLPGEEPGANGLAEVVFTLRMHDGAATRATRAGGESVINDIDILVFEPQGDNTGKLLEVAEWYGMKPMTEEDASVTLKVRLPHGTYNLVVLGNAGDILKQKLDAGTVVPGVSTKADVIQALSVSQSGNWDIESQAIPACGEVASETIDADYQGTLKVELVRMLAKIEIDVSGLDEDLFELTDVLHCNYIPGGLIVPDLTLATGLPTLPQTSAAAAKTPVYSPGDDGKLTFYTFEAAVTPEPSTTGWNTGHCLVLKGKYKGATTSSFYRVDFRNASGTLVAALRNRNYKLEITDVHTSGQPSLAEALNSVSNTLTMQVAEWESGDDIDFIDKNPVYEFRINNGNLLTILKGATATVPLVSTSPYAWSITCDPDNLLTVSPTTGTGDETLNLVAGSTAGTVKLTVNINNAYFTTNITIK